MLVSFIINIKINLKVVNKDNRLFNFYNYFMNKNIIDGMMHVIDYVKYCKQMKYWNFG